MSNVLLSTFWPTRRKTAVATILTVCFPSLAYLLATQRYGPQWRECGVAALMPPAALNSYAPALTTFLDGWPFFVALALIELVYCYAVACLVGWFLGWIRFLQPTRMRITWTLALAIPLTAFGAVFLSTRHPTTEVEVLRTILVPGAEPLWLIANWGLPVWLLLVLAWLLNFLYYYIVVCTVSSVLSAAFGGRLGKGSDVKAPTGN